MNTFDFNGTALRTVTLDEKPWFSLVDVCCCAGLKARTRGGSYTHHLYKIDRDEYRLVDLAGLPTGTSCRGTRRQTVISESGLYTLLLRAQRRNLAVTAFQNWVTRDVLPAIRKTGGYLLNEAARQTAHADTREAMPLPAENRRNPSHGVYP